MIEGTAVLEIVDNMVGAMNLSPKSQRKNDRSDVKCEKDLMLCVVEIK